MYVLYHLTGFLNTSPHLNRCLQCSEVFHPTDCTNVTICTYDELCYTQEIEENGNTVFRMGCLSKNACGSQNDFEGSNVFKRGNVKCNRCCQGENCNRNLCEKEIIGMTTNEPTSITCIATNTPPISNTILTTVMFNYTNQKCYTLNPYLAISSDNIATTYESVGKDCRLKRDCLELYKSGHKENGIYKISPDSKTSFFVYCDMMEGGWTVIQRHTCRAVNFTRGWNDYVNGFGDLRGDHWLGLEHIHLLTNPPCDIILEGIPTDTNETATSKYSSFTLDGPASSYTMHLKGRGILNSVASSHGYAYGGGFSAHNNLKFQTYDHINGHNCATRDRAGWWYGFCYYVHLNIVYSLMDFRAGHPGGRVKASQMKVRRV